MFASPRCRSQGAAVRQAQVGRRPPRHQPRHPSPADLTDDEVQKAPTAREVSVPQPKQVRRWHNHAPASFALQHLQPAAVRRVDAAAQLRPDLSVDILIEVAADLA